jgi:hypothetical protein
MAESKEPDAETPPPPAGSEDDRRAAAAAVNRKRAVDQWEKNKKSWRRMGVPDASPAAGSTKK